MNARIHRAVMWLAVPGIIGAAIIIALVFATGQTFGQRCSVDHKRGSTDWDDCVNRQANTEKMTKPPEKGANLSSPELVIALW